MRHKCWLTPLSKVIGMSIPASITVVGGCRAGTDGGSWCALSPCRSPQQNCQPLCCHHYRHPSFIFTDDRNGTCGSNRCPHPGRASLSGNRRIVECLKQDP